MFAPVHAAPTHAIIHELAVGDDFGANPLSFQSPAPLTGAKEKRMLHVMKRWRDKTVPRILADINEANQTLTQHVKTDGPADDPLSDEVTVVTEEIPALVVGASQKSIEQGLLVASDFEAVVAAAHVSVGMNEENTLTFDGVEYTIAFIKPIARIPFAVAYRLGLKKVGR